MNSVNFQEPQASNILQQDEIPTLGHAKGMYVKKTKYYYVCNYQHPSSFWDVYFTKREKRYNESSLHRVLKIKKCTPLPSKQFIGSH